MKITVKMFRNLALFAMCLVSVLCLWEKADAAAVAYPADGVYSLRPQCAPGRELAVYNASKEKGANVVIWDINSHLPQSTNQRWRIERIGNGQWYKIFAENTGFALDVEGAVAQSGTNLCVWPNGTQSNQLFMFFYCGEGYYIIQPNLQGAFAVDVSNALDANNANVLIWERHDGANQKWKLVKLSD